MPTVTLTSSLLCGTRQYYTHICYMNEDVLVIHEEWKNLHVFFPSEVS